MACFFIAGSCSTEKLQKSKYRSIIFPWTPKVFYKNSQPSTPGTYMDSRIFHAESDLRLHESLLNIKRLQKMESNPVRKNEQIAADPHLEKLLTSAEESAATDLENAEKSDADFIEYRKNLAQLESNAKMEAEIVAVQEKYALKKQKHKSSFLTKLKNIGKYTTGTIATLALVAHFAQKETPDFLPADPEPTKVEWNASTEQEINKVANEYILAVKNDSIFKSMPESVLRQRFMDFIATYGHNIKVVNTEADMNMYDEINEMIFSKVLMQKNGRAHYDAGTIYYEDKHLKDTTKYDSKDFDENASLGNFLSEFSHHINDDWEMRRTFAYAEELVTSGFNQLSMYEDPYTPEYQAHMVTQNAVIQYLTPLDHQFTASFPEIYNTNLEYYNALIATHGYETHDQITNLVFDLTMNKPFKAMAEQKEIVLSNLQKIRETIDALDADKTVKSALFEIMSDRDIYPIESAGVNYEKICDDIKDAIALREGALKDEALFNAFGEKVKALLGDDHDIPPSAQFLFSKPLLEKIDALAGTANYSYGTELYKLHAFIQIKLGTDKAMTTPGDVNNFRNAADATYYAGEYQRAVRNHIAQHPTSDEDQAKNAADIIEQTNNRNFVTGLEYYSRDEEEKLEWYIIENFNTEFYGSWQFHTLINLLVSLQKDNKPDFDRDLTENGTNILSKIIADKKVKN